MKKRFVLVFTLFFLLSTIIFLESNSSYAYDSCANDSIFPHEVTTLNLEYYINSIDYNELKSFCSYDMCYEVKEDNINKSINNFKKIYDKTLSLDNYEEIKVKGYPITKIIVDSC